MALGWPRGDVDNELDPKKFVFVLMFIWMGKFKGEKFTLLKALVHSFLHSFIHSFFHSFIHSFIYSLLLLGEVYYNFDFLSGFFSKCFSTVR